MQSKHSRTLLYALGFLCFTQWLTSSKFVKKAVTNALKELVSSSGGIDLVANNAVKELVKAFTKERAEFAKERAKERAEFANERAEKRAEFAKERAEFATKRLKKIKKHHSESTKT